MSGDLAVERILDQLHERGLKVVARGGGYSAQCSAHEDRSPSLSLRQIEGQALVHCFAGCDAIDVMAALGMTMADLYDDRAGATYPYTDAWGTPTRLVRRRVAADGVGKEFVQTGDKRVPQLYRLPKVIEAVAAVETIWLVEGEKDVHAMEALGVVATTAPMGASNFGLVDVGPLKGAEVIAIADRDAAGQTWAAAVRARLDGYAASLVFVEAKVGKDAADHVGAGHGLDEFVTLGASVTFETGSDQPKGQSDTSDTETPGQRIERLLAAIRDGVWLDAQEFPPLRYAIDGLVPEGFTLLAGPPKVGKSWLVGDLLLSVAAGGRALGHIAVGKPRRVLYLALEDGDRRMQSRCRMLLSAGNPLAVVELPGLYNYVTRVTPAEVLPTIEAFLDVFPDTAMVVIDTLGKVMPPAGPNETTYQRDYRVGGRIKDIADRRPGLAVVVVHHDRKAGSEDFVERVSGTNGLAGSADTIIVLARKRQSEEGLLSVTGRDVPENEYALVMRDGVHWSLDGMDLANAANKARQREENAAGGLSDTSQSIVDFVRSGGAAGKTTAEVVEKFGPDARKYLTRRVDDGRLIRSGRGHYVTPESRVTSVTSSQPQVSDDDESDSAPFTGKWLVSGAPVQGGQWADGLYDREN